MKAATGAMLAVVTFLFVVGVVGAAECSCEQRCYSPDNIKFYKCLETCDVKVACAARKTALTNAGVDPRTCSIKVVRTNGGGRGLHIGWTFGSANTGLAFEKRLTDLTGNSWPYYGGFHRMEFCRRSGGLGSCLHGWDGQIQYIKPVRTGGREYACLRFFRKRFLGKHVKKLVVRVSMVCNGKTVRLESPSGDCV